MPDTLTTLSLTPAVALRLLGLHYLHLEATVLLTEAVNEGRDTADLYGDKNRAAAALHGVMDRVGMGDWGAFQPAHLQMLRLVAGG